MTRRDGNDGDASGGPGTPDAETLRAAVLAAVDAGAAEAVALSRWMAAHPELSLQEHRTAERYQARLAARGFAIEPEAAGLETAFIARRGPADAPLRAALLAEMDALPGIGHACGHNLSGPASLLAAEALADALPPEAARIVVVGTPAEEIGAGKKALVEAGAFADVDVAMMAHASDMRRAHRLFLGNRKLELVYRGRASHAAAYPEQGRNALDGVITLFVSIGLLRQQLPPGVRIHGIVSDGGQAPNIIPERAAARVWVRSLDEDELDAAFERVLDCANGAARASQTALEVHEEAGSSPPMKPNPPLAGCYARQLERLGLPESGHEADRAIGSSDITHVSRVVPTIHPNFPINEPGQRLQLHTREFAQATTSPAGEAGLLEAARALALTVVDLALDPALRERVRAAHGARAPGREGLPEPELPA